MDTDPPPRIRPLHVVFCDDIRREITGKEILIGVYSGNLLVNGFPAPVVLATWVPFLRVENSIGKLPIAFRMQGENNRTVGYGSMEVTLTNTSETGALSMPTLAIVLQGPGNLIFQLQQYDEPWQTVGTLKVEKRPESATSSSVPSPPPSPLPSVPAESASLPAPRRRERRVRRRRV
jgi:hypothetical protein